VVLRFLESGNLSILADGEDLILKFPGYDGLVLLDYKKKVSF
jgi:hypothetical protein